MEENIILLKYPFYNNIEPEVFCRSDNDCIATESCKPESEHPRSDNSGKSQNINKINKSMVENNRNINL